jgi:DNA-binding transcriptional LysR family regulator
MTDRTTSLPFDLRALEIFLATCEAGSMAEAANRLSITQPAVSLAIAELERKTGSAVFDRSVRPLGLTVAGGMLRQRASALLADAHQIAPLLREAQRGHVPAIRVGLVDSLNRTLAVPLTQFLSTRANEVSILSGLTASHAGELLTRRLDLFLGVDDLEDMPGLERQELLTEPYILLTPAKTPDAKTLPELKRLAEMLPLVRFSARSQTGLEIERHLRRLGIECPRQLEFDSPLGVTAAVASGVGFAISTPLCVEEAMIDKRKLRLTKLPGPKVARRITLVARGGEMGDIPKQAAEKIRPILRAAAAAHTPP